MAIARTSRVWLYSILTVVVILVAARLALPWALKRYANKTLNEIPGYHGHVNDVGVALWRGAYQFNDLALYKTGTDREPLFAVESIDVQIDWPAIWHKRVVCRIRMIHPELQFIQRKSKDASQTHVDESWQDKVRKLIPLDINRFHIVKGVIRYKNEASDPVMNFYLHAMRLDAENISNARHENTRLPTPLTIRAKLMQSGNLSVDAQTNFLTDPIEGKLKLAVSDLSLKELNNFTRAEGNFDFEGGEFGLATEIIATKTHYDGYIKPIFTHVKVVDWKKERAEGDSVLHLVWESIVGGVISIFKNQAHDQFAARIPISGDRKDPETGTWATLVSILRNGFIKALSPQLENKINLKDADKKAAKDGDKKGDKKEEKKPIEKKQPDKNGKKHLHI